MWIKNGFSTIIFMISMFTEKFKIEFTLLRQALCFLQIFILN
ncbi:hypothetical protein TCARB_0076 [Thermofilum adornatum 1505]|uniref:Uncharacterized protein n=1 Tax=Thermofilum adornatum 1505 TaxID=697581 RepID=A0A3G1A775_9CREN|nr:hypothetical protein TCARB_0076 [Thermofilum adornatum 1505]